MVIFEGQELVLHHVTGDSDYLLVTFEGAWKTHIATTSFLGATPIKKNRINAIGVTAKVDHWYISPETEIILDKINQIARNYKTIILIGLSMGGHAAISFSKQLNATAVFAAAPKWSLDPDECDIPGEYVERNFRSGMERMGLRQSQVQGEIFVAYDPAETVDYYHAHKIADAIEAIHLVPTFHTGHLIFDHICGSENFRSLLEVLRSPQGVTELPGTVSKIRRQHPTNIKQRLRKATSSHPCLCKDLYERCLQDEGPSLKTIDNDRELSNRILAALCWHGYMQEASDYLRTVTYFRVTGSFPVPASRSSQIRANVEKILTYHGNLLAYDAENHHFTCQNSFLADNSAIPVLRDPGSERNVLCISLHGQIFYIRETEDGLLLTSEMQDRDILALTIFDPAQTHDKFLYSHHPGYCIRTREGYLCSSPDYTVSLDSPNSLEWESYTCIPD
ncbi:hypothetical protein [Acetobacter conturbans]|uniref:Alpha/beta hydrolase n=1 Tax=Acetobacter conturbans TaxID=1737472 RepID=A0ABX0JYW5_9PROT|nr:hypothetical protein [Acetobacter conturbans]NHN88538.1 hypothetical protein [Acetobacter conturbans]